MDNQKKLWNNIAKEWSKFRKQPILIIKEFLEKSNGKILDLGCGSGRHLIKSKNKKYYCLDFSENMLKLAEKKAILQKIKALFFKSDLSKLPFENNFFDYAIYIDSLHCIKSKNKRKNSLKELHRVLKNNSKAIISVWNKNSKRFRNSEKEKYISWRDKGKRYHYLFEEKELENLLKKYKFKINKNLTDNKRICFIVKKP